MFRKFTPIFVVAAMLASVLAPGLTSTAQASDGPTDWAILICGGWNTASNNARYWNDLSEMYEVLTGTYDYTAANIFVLYADGNPPTAANCADDEHVHNHYPTDIIDYAATSANLDTVTDTIAASSHRDDTLFVFSTDHGADTGNMCLWGETTISPATFAGPGYMGDITEYSWRAFEMEQCHSGCFVAPLSGPRTMIATACRCDEPSCGAGASLFYYDPFCYYFNAALKSALPVPAGGGAVDADANDDGEVSFVEAFNYAEANDYCVEQPQYDDDGDGTSHTGQMPAGGDGCLGSMTFLGQTHTAIERGLGWLCANQNPNGSWTYSGRVTEDNVGLTSMATTAFLNYGAGESDPTVENAIEWILSKQRGDGCITNGPYEVYDTSLAILAIVATRDNGYYDEIQAATDFLVGIQNDEDTGFSQSDQYYGGWPYYESMGYWADLSNSQFVLLALWYAEQFNSGDTIVPQDVWDEAEVFITRCQNRESSNPDYNFYDDGGFIYQPASTIWAGGQSYGSMTAAGLWGLFACGVGESDGRVQDAWGWIQNNYYVDQNYPMGSLFVYYYIYSLAKACLLWGVDEINGHDWYQEMSQAAADYQEADGHWPGTHPSEEPDNVATCWALLALESKSIPAGTGLHIEVHSPADLHVYDPLGRHVGINYETGEIEIEIPGATYSGPGSEPQIIEIPNPMAGTYRIELVGTEKGDYTLTIEGRVDGTTVHSRSFEGSIDEGEQQGLDAIVSAVAGPITIDIPDTIAPGVVNDLATGEPAVDLVALNWTAPGDDWSTGTASEYDVRYSTELITEANWDGAIQCAGEPAPQPAGSSEVFTVTGLAPGTTYYFALKTADEIPNWSELSNIAQGSTFVTAIVDFQPDVLNLEAKGKYVTAYIELPTGYDVGQIDVSSVRLNSTVPALAKPTQIGDYDDDSIPDLMLKFDASAVKNLLLPGDQVEIVITGDIPGIGFQGTDTINRVVTPEPPGHAAWTRITTPTTEGFVMAPDSIIVDYAVTDDGDAAYAILYSYNTSQFHLLKSTDGAATWEDTMDALEEEADGEIDWLVDVATDAENADFVAVALEMTDSSVHVFISDDGGATFEDAGEVEDGGVYFPNGYDVSDIEVSPEVGGNRSIAIGGSDNYGDAALFRCVATGDSATAWEDATNYVGWDDDGDFTSMLLTDIIFSPSWETDKTILVATVADYGPYYVHLQCGSWGTTPGWNEMSTLGIEAVEIFEGADIPIWLADFEAGAIAGITVPGDYNSKDTNARVLWVWVNYYDEYEDDYPACVIMRVDDDSADPVGPLGQIEDGELWLTNVFYKGNIAEGEAIAGVLGTGTYDPVSGSPEDLFAECCYGVQVFRNDGIRNMDICCERWHDACKPPTGAFVMTVSYVGEDKAYAVALWGFLSHYDEDAWSVSFDDGDFWNQLSLIDTKIDYLSDVAVSPDCNKTILASVNKESGCECDSVWLHAESLPEAPEYSGKWLRTWCGQLEGDIGGGWERGLLRLAPEETTGDTVYLFDYGTSNVYLNIMETLACWDPIGSTELDYIVDLAAQDADTLYALDYYGDVAMFDDEEWQEPLGSNVEYGWTIAVQGDHILVGGCEGDVSYSDDGGATFTELEDVPVGAADYTLVTVDFDSYFDANDTIYAASAGFVGSNPTTGGIYRWVIGESEEWEDLGAENYAYTGLVLNSPSGGKPETSPDTGGVLYASYVSGVTTGAARCLTPAEDMVRRIKWDYLTNGLTSELFKMMPRALKVCGGLTSETGSKLFAIDSNDYYDMESGMTGTVWSFQD